MLRRSLLVIAATSTTLASPLRAQLTGSALWADSARREIEAGAVRGDVARLLAAEALLDRALTAMPGEPLLLHYRGYALYRQAALAVGMDRTEDAKAALEDADTTLEQSAAKLALPETFALRSAVIGQKIGLGGMLDGMRLGPKASQQMDRALELGKDNPRVWLLHGISAIFTPAMFGGGLDKAEERLRRAIALFESDRPLPPAPAWGRADAYIWLGQVLEKRQRRDEARAAYARALELEPSYGWARGLAAKLERPDR